MQQLALFFLAAAAVGGVAWVFLYPLLSGERQAEKRMENVAKTDRVAAAKATRTSPKVRRDQLEDTLKELEASGELTRMSRSCWRLRATEPEFIQQVIGLPAAA